MSKKLFLSLANIFVLCILLYTNSYSQVKTSYNLFSVADNSALNTTELKNAVSDALIFNLNKEELGLLCDAKNPEISLDIPYMQNQTARLNLKRFDMLTPDAKIVARTAAGNEEVKLSDIAVSYNGTVEGFPNSLVSITFTRDNVTGLLVTNNDNLILGALTLRNGNSNQYILYKESDLKVKNSFLCAAEDKISSENIEKTRRIIQEGLGDSPTDLYVAEIAIEMDYATYNVYGASVQNASNYAIALMSASSAIYMKEVNVRFVIPYIRVWVTPDPYTGSNSNQLLNQFRAEWNANQQSVQRTLAHFITRRGGGLGGIAWVNALCSSVQSGYGYGLSGTDGPILPLPTYSWDVMVVSHELGHNFGSNHTHWCGWLGGPIDSCYATEGGCYTGPVIPRVGTIMSYCHLNGSISLVYGFGPQPREVVRNGAESASCMYVSNRDLVVAYPNGGERFRTGNSTQIYWGSSLTGNVNLELSVDNGTSWQTIQNNVPATQRIYDWTIPYMASNENVKLRIVNSANPAVGDTSDAAFTVVLNLNSFSVLSPPTLTRLGVSSTSPDVQRFTWSSAGTDPSIRYKFKIRKIGTTVDYAINSNNNGSDTAADIRLSNLDSIAQLMGTVGDSVRCSWRGWAYNGIDSSSAANTFLITLYRTGVGVSVISSIVPEKFNLENNYPNPFNPVTNIKFDIAKSTNVKLTVFDSRGREISSLVNENLAPGSYSFSFDASNLPSGAYFYRLSTAEFTETKRMVLIK